MNTGYNPFASIGRQLKDTWQSVTRYVGQAGNLVKQTPEAQSMLQGLQNVPVGGTPSPYQPPKYYQVTGNETGMDDVAQQTGIPLPDIVSANNGAKTLPPKGSYIQLLKEGVPPSVAGQISGIVPQSASLAQSARPGGPELRGDYAARALQLQAQKVMQQIATGQDPQTIPMGAAGFITNAAGERLTAQVLVSMGYVANPQTGNWELKGEGMGAGIGAAGLTDPQAGSPGHYYVDATTAPFVNQIITVNGRRRKLRQDKNGRLYYEKIGQSRRGRAIQFQRRQQAQAAAAAALPMEQTQTTTATPEIVLDLHLGSG